MSMSIVGHTRDGEEVPLEAALSLTESLAAYAEGATIGKAIQARLNGLLILYIEGDLDDAEANQVEALMRSNASVARMIADKTEDTHLDDRLFSFLLGELDAENSADVQHMINNDPEVARRADELREMVDGTHAAMLSVEPASGFPELTKLINMYPMGPLPEAAPIDSYTILIDYADGKRTDKKTKVVLDNMVLDYIDGELDSEVACDVETLMQLFASVAQLVADMTEEALLESRISMFLDGELDAEDSVEVRRLIRNDPKVAKLASRFREAMDFYHVVMQSILDQPVSLEDVKLNKSYPLGPALDTFRTLHAYALGMTIDVRTQAALDRVLTQYIDGGLDSAIARALEASMRLSKSVARLVAETAEAKPM